MSEAGAERGQDEKEKVGIKKFNHCFILNVDLETRKLYV
jgi:hypothetical protein